MSADTAQKDPRPNSGAAADPVGFVPIPVIINCGDQPMSSIFDQAQLFTKLWIDYATKVASASMRSEPDATPHDTARNVRSAMFEAMTQTADQFLRSPQYLEMLKQSLDMAMGFRKQMNDFLTRMHHEAQGTARQDVDSLMLSMRHLETRVLDCMENLTAKLESISRRLDALEGAAHQGNGEKAPPPERPVRKSPREKTEKAQKTQE